MNTIKAYWLGASILILLSCNNNKQPVKASTDAISIPASADSARAETESAKGKAVISFEYYNHDFGRITSGEKVEYSFKFKNTGKGELLISSAYASCGCTVPEYSKEPIQPGQSGLIKVTFDSYMREDYFTKTITVASNTVPPENMLTIKGFIIPKEVLEPGLQKH